MNRLLRECIALTTTAGFAFVVLLVCGGQGFGPARALPPPSIGTYVPQGTASDLLAPAGKPAGASRARPAAVAQAPAAKGPERKAEASPPRPARLAEGPAGEPEPSPGSKKAPREQGSSGEEIRLVRETAPEPTVVEPAPRQTTEMSDAEIRQAVADYRGWVHQGQIRLRINHSSLSAEQLAALAEFWVLTSARGNQVCVDRTGRKEDGKFALDGVLIGDLEPTKWPKFLIQQAKDRFGTHSVATGVFVVRDRYALLFYRQVAMATRGRLPEPGSTFELQLLPGRDGTIDVELAHTSRTPLAQRSYP